MADKKIPELPELSGPPASNDIIEIVDVSDTTDDASGTSKFIQASNFIGPEGDPGADGADGNIWFVGTIGSPPTALTTGDLLLDSDNGNVYQAGGPGSISWGSPVTNIQGADGHFWFVASSTPSATKAGDLWLDSTNGNVYQASSNGSASWGSVLANLLGPAASLYFNAILAATNTNTIDNGSYNQTWNWSSASGDALTIGIHGTSVFQIGWDGAFSRSYLNINTGVFYFGGSVFEINSGVTLKLFGGSGSAQFSAIPDPSGGIVVDDECRAALAALLAAFRTRGDLGI